MVGHTFNDQAKAAASNVAGTTVDATAQVGEQAEAALKQMSELGTEAIDQIDEYLKPYGLSLKENPGTVIAILGGVALAAGALLMSRKTKADNIANQIGALLRRAGV
jgi:ElaB/YqjD/DUF883 family membrane-anchored ribosome-binding protein